MTKIESDDYKRGWYDGYQAAQNDSTRIYPTQPLGPARTLDIMWPDRIPSTKYTDHSRPCHICNKDLAKLDSYVCYHPNCSQLYVGPLA